MLPQGVHIRMIMRQQDQKTTLPLHSPTLMRLLLRNHNDAVNKGNGRSFVLRKLRLSRNNRTYRQMRRRLPRSLQDPRSEPLRGSVLELEIKFPTSKNAESTALSPASSEAVESSQKRRQTCKESLPD